MKECYEEYTKNFSNKHFQSEEVRYYSRYAPMVIVEVTPNQILDIAKIDGIMLISDSEYVLDDAEVIDSNFNNMPRSHYYNGDYYYTMQEIKSYIGISSLRNLALDNLGYINIGVIDSGYPVLYNSSEYSNKIFEQYPNYALSNPCHGDGYFV